MHEHEIFVSVNLVCCTCGYTSKQKNYAKARAAAVKHALVPGRTFIIKPLSTN